jgi:hypothetical protein
MLIYQRALFIGFALFHTSAVWAYLGPGLGAGTLGVIVGLLGSILLALFAIFWYPLKRQLTQWGLIGKSEAVDQEDDEVVQEEQEDT